MNPISIFIGAFLALCVVAAILSYLPLSFVIWFVIPAAILTVGFAREGREKK